MGPRNVSTQYTRKRILDASFQLFIDNGFHGSSMRRIARSAGVSLGNLYNYFDGKEALFAAVLFEFHPYHQILPALQAARGETVEDLVRDAARQLVTHLGGHPEFLNLMFIELIELEGQHMPALVGTIMPQVLSALEPLTEQTESRAGERLRPISGPLLMRAFIGLFFSYYVTEMFFAGAPGGWQDPHGLETFVDIFLHGVLGPWDR